MRKEFTPFRFTGNLEASVSHAIDVHSISPYEANWEVRIGIDPAWVAGPAEVTSTSKPVHHYVVPLDRGYGQARTLFPSAGMLARIAAWAGAKGIRGNIKAIAISLLRGYSGKHTITRWGPAIKDIITRHGYQVTSTEGI